MKNLCYFELVLYVLIGACGLALLIGGICMKALISIIIGIAGIAFPIVMIWFDKKYSD